MENLVRGRCEGGEVLQYSVLRNATTWAAGCLRLKLQDEEQGQD